jgi:hypothetical protein
VACALVTACAGRVEPDVSQVAQGVVYDADDRQELNLAPTDGLRRFGEQSVVALVDGSAQADARAVFFASAWGERRDLCPGVRFAEQPSAAACSGVLVTPELVLTAGHCARNLDCNTLNVVFGFRYLDAMAIPALGDDDVYRCAEIPSFEIPSAFDTLDYGWVRLDRPVSADKQPAAIEHAAKALPATTALQALNFGGGVPLKIQTGVSVLDARAGVLDYFVTALDAFEGASGGPLIRDDGTLVGIVVHGNEDYTQSAEGCLEVAVLPESAGNERATYAFQAVAGLCRDSPARAGELCRYHEANAAGAGCSVGRRADDGSQHWVAVVACAAAAALRRRRVRRLARSGRLR